MFDIGDKNVSIGCVFKKICWEIFVGGKTSRWCTNLLIIQKNLSDFGDGFFV